MRKLTVMVPEGCNFPNYIIHEDAIEEFKAQFDTSLTNWVPAKITHDLSEKW